MNGKTLANAFALSSHIVTSIETDHRILFVDVLKFLNKIKRLLLSGENGSKTVYYAELFKQ